MKAKQSGNLGLSQKVMKVALEAVALILPRGYPNSVDRSYLSYASWHFLATCFSSVSGVLSMQALLHAVGLGSGAIPMAAALNWVIKDGLGQLGGIVFASAVSTRFDADPKKWRVVAALSLDAAVLLELLTPMMPSFFLFLAAIANVGKNVACLAASASRAAMHQALALHENLADVTVKAGSQSILASLVGTTVGVALSSVLGFSPVQLLLPFALLSAGHLLCVAAAVRAVPLKSLNRRRIQLICNEFARTSAVKSPDQICEVETVFGVAASEPPIVLGAPLIRLAATHSDLIGLQQRFSGDAYVLNTDKQTNEVLLLFKTTASPADVLWGFVHATQVAQRINAGSEHIAGSEVLRFDAIPRLPANTCSEEAWTSRTFCDVLRHKGWHLDTLLLDEDIGRVSFV